MVFIIFFSQYKIQDGIPILIGDESYDLQKQFFQQHPTNNEKQVFLIGSSQIIALNTTFIDNYLEKHNHIFHIYNLAYNSDQPKERLKTIDMLISAKPDIVMYGIAPRDFQRNGLLISSSQPSSFLPDPQVISQEITNGIEQNLGIDLDFLASPKLITLQDIKQITKEKSPYTEFFPYPDIFVKVDEKSFKIRSNDELKTLIPLTTPITSIDVKENDNEIALEKIIEKFKKNNIEVIIISVPQSRVYLDTMSESYKISFDSILDSISRTSNVKIIRLDDKYADFHIWTDPMHIAIGNSTIYSEDVAKAILNKVTS